MSKKNLAACCGMLLSALLAPSGASAADWPSAGRDLKNSRYQSDERAISPRTVRNLTLRWSIDTSGDVTANPAVDAGHLYFPDSAGFLYKVDRLTGAIVWKRQVSEYTGIPGDFARATPAIAGNALIFGNQAGKFLGASFGQGEPQPARVVAVDKISGNPIWSTQVDATARSFVTHSAIVANGRAIVGTASNEELVAAFVPKDYWYWQFRGSVSALDVATGQVLWKTYMVPGGYNGGAVWGSTGSVDLNRNQVYMATGNNYMLPDGVLACLNAGNPAGSCMSADNHFDSIVAMDLTTGRINWAARGLPSDTWNVACGLVAPGFVVGPWFPGVYANCPNGNPGTAGPDWDFAQGPLLFADTGNDADVGLVGAGQKSGVFWAFRAKDGKLAWSRQVAPGGVTGGLQWGSASDGQTSSSPSRTAGRRPTAAASVRCRGR